MNLEDIQSWAANRLATDPALSNAVVLMEDGSYPKTPQREEALNTTGLVLLVWYVESGGIESMTPDGHLRQAVLVHVVIEENQAKCRAQGGANIPAEKALRLVQERMLAAPPGWLGRVPMLAADPPFAGFGKVNGVNRWVASFVMTVQTVAANLPAPPPLPLNVN